MKPTHTDVVIILALLSNELSNNNSIKHLERIATVYRRIFMKKLGGILLLTLMKTKVTGKIQSTPVTIHRTR
jgi:hypothetical protein